MNVRKTFVAHGERHLCFCTGNLYHVFLKLEGLFGVFRPRIRSHAPSPLPGPDPLRESEFTTPGAGLSFKGGVYNLRLVPRFLKEQAGSKSSTENDSTGVTKLYLRLVKFGDRYRFLIRITYREGGFWKQRDLFDLGEDPAEFIEYPGGNGFYFRPEIEDALDSQGVEYTSEDLEDVFIDFLDPAIRRIIERSRQVDPAYRLSRACSGGELAEYQQELHPFDVRRLHYLKFGRMDMGTVETDLSWKFLKVLSCKCRDEIEATFDLMERDLPQREFRSYIYTALHLQSHFAHHILQNYPIGLDPEKVDSHFLEELCRLNGDERFFRGVEASGHEGLHSFLAKYVWLYFDHGFEAESPWEGFARDFLHQRRQYQKPVASAPSITLQQAYEVFEISAERLASMKRKDLVRLYRRKAKKLHPDKGGDHDKFVKLSEAYELLVASKR